MSDWVVIGVPTSAGAHHAGPGPGAGGAARGRADRGAAGGGRVGARRRRPARRGVPGRPRAPRRAQPAAVVRVASEVADAVAAVGDGELPLVIGGDCTITLGVIAGFRRRHPDVGLVYVDGDADLGSGSDTGSGILDSAGVAHLLGHGLARAGRPGRARRRCSSRRGWPCWAATRGRPTTRAGSFLAGAGVSFQEGPALIADPAGAARRAVDAVAAASGPVVVHFDVDIIDSGDLPLSNFPHYGSRVLLEDVGRCLRVLRPPSVVRRAGADRGESDLRRRRQPAPALHHRPRRGAGRARPGNCGGLAGQIRCESAGPASGARRERHV